MKKAVLLFLLLLTSITYGQTTLANKLKITGNSTSLSASKVNVQESDGQVNTIAKSDLIDVLEYASAINLPTTGVSGKIYVTIDNKKMYRWNGTIYQELALTNISGKEDVSNKQNSLAIDGTGTKYPTVDAVNTIDLQKVIDVGGYAELDGGNSYIFFGDEDGELNFSSYISDGLGNDGGSFVGKGYVDIFSNSPAISSRVAVDNGEFKVSKQNTSGSTNIIIDSPVQTTTLNFPAKTVAGDYTLATTDEVVDLTNDQNIFGEKTFEDNILAEKIIRIRDSDLSGYGELQNNLDALEYKSAGGQLRLGVNSNGIIFGEGDQCSLSTILLTDDRSILIPDVSGNLAVISQTITNGVTDKSPSEDAVYDAIDRVVKTIISDTPTSTNTGGVSEVLMHTYTIAGGKLPASCMPNLKIRIAKTGTAGTVTVKVRVNTVNDFATATNIGFFTSATSMLGSVFVRNFTLQGGQLTHTNAAVSSINDESATTNINGVITYDPSVTQYWFFSLQNSNSGDTTRIHSIKLVN